MRLGDEERGDRAFTLIEPVSYAGADTFIHDYSGRNFTKLTHLDRPYCQTLICEVYNSCCSAPAFEWAHSVYGLDTHEARQARRHYGGRSANRNGSNWLFADLHVNWHSLASLPNLFCCQDFSMNPHVRDAERAGTGISIRPRIESFGGCLPWRTYDAYSPSLHPHDRVGRAV